MSRLIRITIALLSVILLCAGLCGCQALDELRAHSGRIQSDGSSVMLDGTVFRSFVLSDNIHPIHTSFTDTFVLASDDQADLPLLLYPFLAEGGAYYSCTEDGTMFYDIMTNHLYCREDIAQEVSAVLDNSASFDKYCTLPSYYGSEDILYLTEEEIRAIQETVKGEPLLSDSYDEYTWVKIQKANEKVSIAKETGFAIGYEGSDYFLYDYASNMPIVYRYTIPISSYSTLYELYLRCNEEDNTFLEEAY